MDEVRERQVDRWASHPIAARLVRLAIFVVPFATAMAMAYVLSSKLPIAEAVPVKVLRWIGIVAASTVAMMVVDRVARRLLPLSALLKLTLVFPDQAPSRFTIAMRTGTTSQLKKRLEHARQVPHDETPQEAAERLLELVGLLSHHDRLTRGHSERVRAYTHLIGDELGLTGAELDKLRWAGLLHDIGKTAIATDILNKPGELTDAEFAVVMTHPEAGRALVGPLADWLGESIRAVWEHHERFDGTGYPRGLAGLDISFAARVVTVADSYDVMTSARSYKKPMSAAAARAELAECSGTQFDPVVVRAFLNLSLGRLRIMSGPLAWFAQLALFEPSGVVHASATAGGTSTGASASGVGAGAASSVGSSGVVSTFSATAASLVISTAGFVVASPPVKYDDAPAPVIAYADEATSLGWPFDEVVLVDAAGDGSLSNSPAFDAFVIQPDTIDDAASTPLPPTNGAPPANAETPPGASAAPRSTTASLPSVPTSTPVPSVTLPTTPAPPTTTIAPPLAQSPETTTTTIPTYPPPGSSATFYFGGNITTDMAAIPYHVLGSSAPPVIEMPNYDTDRDMVAGSLVRKSSGGIMSTDPADVVVFRGAVTSPMAIDANVKVELWVADKTFGTSWTRVQVGLFRCSDAQGCELLGSDDHDVNNNVEKWKRVSFVLGDVNGGIAVGDWLEVRVAVLDSSDGDAKIGFGTSAFASKLIFRAD